jgi:hypothetical protein
METSSIAQQKYVQMPTVRRRTDAYRLLEDTRPSTGTLSGEGHNNKQCSLQWDAYWQVEACNSKQTPRTAVSKGVELLRDNAHPHTAAHTAKILQKLKSSVMAHPPYSPDLALSDYHLFGSLKGVDSPWTKKWGKQCLCGSLLSQKCSFLRA